jgi:leader peptidase (prepilin peptidase)/N-methyltransferase
MSYEIFIIFILGICIGSFLNVVIYRVPLRKSIITPPSSCPKCNARIKPQHNIPILGWIILKGRCNECGERISIRYPLIELLTGILAILVYIKMKEINIYFVFTFASFATLLALCMIDFDYKAVPDSLNLLALSFAFFQLCYFPLLLQIYLKISQTHRQTSRHFLCLYFLQAR